MERLIEHDVTTPPKELYERRAAGKQNAEAFAREIVAIEKIPEPLIGWARHIAWLASFLDAGARVDLDDFKAYEWDGIAKWRNAQANVRARYRFCPQCGTALRSGRTHCPWCHWREKEPGR